MEQAGSLLPPLPTSQGPLLLLIGVLVIRQPARARGIIFRVSRALLVQTGSSSVSRPMGCRHHHPRWRKLVPLTDTPPPSSNGRGLDPTPKADGSCIFAPEHGADIQARCSSAAEHFFLRVVPNFVCVMHDARPNQGRGARAVLTLRGVLNNFSRATVCSKEVLVPYILVYCIHSRRPG